MITYRLIYIILYSNLFVIMLTRIYYFNANQSIVLLFIYFSSSCYAPDRLNCVFVIFNFSSTSLHCAFTSLFVVPVASVFSNISSWNYSWDQLCDRECTEVAIKCKLRLTDALRSVICKAGSSRNTYIYIYLLTSNI